jgi:hypothetical protein
VNSALEAAESRSWDHAALSFICRLIQLRSGGKSVYLPVIANDSSLWQKSRIQKVHPSGARQAAEKLGISGEIGGKRLSGAKAHTDSVGLMRGLKPAPPSEPSFSAACKALLILLHLRHD